MFDKQLTGENHMKKLCAGVVFRRSALRELDPGRMLSDDVINVYTALLSGSFADVKFMSSYVISDLLKHNILRERFKVPFAHPSNTFLPLCTYISSL